jgi:hypothetical protein
MLKAKRSRVPNPSLVVKNNHTPPRKLIPAHTAKIIKKT